MFRILVVIMVLATVPVLAADTPSAVPADLQVAAGSVETSPALDATDEPISLSRDAEGAVLRSFTIEGEDRVSISFDRPGIKLDLDPRQAPGLGWENSWDKVDVLPAVTAQTALASPRFAGQPWLDAFARDEVVVFSPEAPEMTSWKLTVVDSRGKPAMIREGKGAPPAHLAWNGRRDDGQAAWPGLIYSFVLETVDPAGNRRTTSGRGFGLPAYRLTGGAEDLLVFSGEELVDRASGAARTGLAAGPLMQEAASWLNQAPGLTRPIEIRATARSRGQALKLAQLVSAALVGQVCGDPERIQTVVEVLQDAPDQGLVEIASTPAPEVR